MRRRRRRRKRKMKRRRRRFEVSKLFRASLSVEISKAVKTETVVLWFMLPCSLVGFFFPHGDPSCHNLHYEYLSCYLT
jgi:hypothetical protein